MAATLQKTYPPSEAQRDLILRLIDEGREPPPSGWLEDKYIAKKYLDETIGDIKKEPSPVSEKQLNLIGKMCKKLNLEMPELKDSKEASKFISQNLESYSAACMSKPSDEKALEEDF